MNAAAQSILCDQTKSSLNPEIEPTVILPPPEVMQKSVEKFRTDRRSGKSNVHSL